MYTWVYFHEHLECVTIAFVFVHHWNDLLCHEESSWHHILFVETEIITFSAQRSRMMIQTMIFENFAGILAWNRCVLKTSILKLFRWFSFIFLLHTFIDRNEQLSFNYVSNIHLTLTHLSIECTKEKQSNGRFWDYWNSENLSW